MNRKKRFHTLDALRFFAFLKVYLLHVPLQGDFPIFSFLKSGGGIGVSFFFVLSGFLITYLLVFEKTQNGQINIRKFFIRRSLRIYPLFFFLVGLAFLLPYELKEKIGFHMIGGGYDLDWRYSFTFLENYKMLLTDNFPKTTPLSVFWSLCIEEHFYITWMIVLFLIPKNRILIFLISCVFIAWTARYFDPMIWGNSIIQQNDLFTNMDYFAIGGILGWLVVKKYNQLVKFIESISLTKKYFFIFAVIILVIFQSQILPEHIFSLSIIRPTIIALAFTFLIAIFIPPNSKIRIKESNPISYLGKISFGLYVYHLIFVHVLFQYFLKENILMNNWWTVGFFMAVTFGGSVVISIFSFRYLESPFLKWRNRMHQ
ncbi:MAG: acyltransferase family protein [Saprospiraceae bacterium]